MILVDAALEARQRAGLPVRVALVGAGFMGRGFVNQVVNSVPGMKLVAVVNRTLERAERAYGEAGESSVRLAQSAVELDKHIAEGVPTITDDASVVVTSDSVDAIVEATGAVEYGAHVVTAAIDGGKHVVLLNAELDGTVGPLLKRRAASAGVVFSGCDGDQPGVEMNLYRFVTGIGATPLLCGNIKGLQDPYRNPTTQEAFARRWGQDPYMVTSFADGTKISFEQALVANATGMTVLRRGMLGYDHSGHVDELTSRFDVEQLRDVGGAVEYVVGSQPGPGVFVLATHDDPKQRHYLELYKLGKGPLYSFYTPYHLCHFEVPTSVARAVLFADAVIAPLDGPRVEVLTTAKVDLAAGTTLDGMGGYSTYGQAERADVTRDQRLLPIGVAEGCRLRQAVSKDAVLTYDDVDLPQGRLVDRLRAEQAAMFS